MNWLAVIVAAVVYFILGALWYSPLLFAGPFLKYRGLSAEELDGGNSADYLLVFIGALVAVRHWRSSWARRALPPCWMGRWSALLRRLAWR